MEINFIERISKRSVLTPGGCWEFTGAKKCGGYGIAKFQKTGSKLIHKLVKTFLEGPYPLGMVTDHLCRNHACWNPEHLEVVTRGENLRRGERALPRKTCKRGHAWEGNEKRVKGRGNKWTRTCLKCRKESQNRYLLTKLSMADISSEKLALIQQDIKDLCDRHSVDLTVIQKHEILVKEREPKSEPAQSEPNKDVEAQ